MPRTGPELRLPSHISTPALDISLQCQATDVPEGQAKKQKQANEQRTLMFPAALKFRPLFRGGPRARQKWAL